MPEIISMLYIVYSYFTVSRSTRRLPTALYSRNPFYSHSSPVLEHLTQHKLQQRLSHPRKPQLGFCLLSFLFLTTGVRSLVLRAAAVGLSSPAMGSAVWLCRQLSYVTLRTLSGAWSVRHLADSDGSQRVSSWMDN